MRLINTTTWCMAEFPSDETAPPYAILSHTWDVEEVSLHDWNSKSYDELVLAKGFQKINYCCTQARITSIDWAWVDT